MVGFTLKVPELATGSDGIQKLDFQRADFLFLHFALRQFKGQNYVEVIKIYTNKTSC